MISTEIGTYGITRYVRRAVKTAINRKNNENIESILLYGDILPG